MVSRQPRLCVAVINYNGSRDTLECLRSLGRSTYTEFETLVVDNASKDDSVKRIQAECPEVEVVRLERNAGYAGGCNEALRRALSLDAAQCLVLNNDTIVDSHAMGLLIELLRDRPEVAAVGPKVLDYYHRRHILSMGGSINMKTGWSEHTGKGEEDRGAPNLPYEVHGFLDGSAMMLSLDVVESTGMMDESLFLYFEDSDWCYRARKNGYSLMIEPRAVVWHKLGGAAGPTDPRVQYISNRNRVIFEKRYASRTEWLEVWVRVPWSKSQQVAPNWTARASGKRDYRSIPHVVKGLTDGLLGGSHFSGEYRFE